MSKMLAKQQCLKANQTLRHAFSTVAATASAVNNTANQVIQLSIREGEGSRYSRRLRKQGLLPGIIYGESENGENEKLLVSLPARRFQQLHRKLWSSIDSQVFSVQVDNSEPILAIMRDVQFDPVTDLPLAVNFIRYKDGRKVKLPIKYINEEGSPGIKRGGYINYIYHELECYLYTTTVPKALELDINGLHVGDSLYLTNITFPEGVVPVQGKEFPNLLVGRIGGRRGLIPRVEVVEEEVIEEEEEEEEEREFNDWTDIF